MAKQPEKALLAAYLVVGDDALKKEAVIKRMRIRLEKLGDLSFNSDAFDGESASGEEIVSACTTIPFASEKRLVMVSNAEKLKKSDADEVIAYLKEPLDSTVLLLIATKLARNTRLYKAVASLGSTAIIDCARPKRNEMSGLVKSMAQKHQLTLTEGAARALVELLGEDTVRLDGELAKLALSQDAGAVIEESQIRSVVFREAEAKPWDLTDALGARDVKKAISVLSRMPSASPYSLLGTCVSRIRELICVKAVSSRSGGAQALAGELGQPEWRVRNLSTWARNYSEPELERALEDALFCEKNMKSGTDPDAAFRTWLLSVLRPSSGAGKRG